MSAKANRADSETFFRSSSVLMTSGCSKKFRASRGISIAQREMKGRALVQCEFINSVWLKSCSRVELCGGFISRSTHMWQNKMADRIKSDVLHEGDSEDTDLSAAGLVSLHRVDKPNTRFKMYIKSKFKFPQQL